MIQTIYSWISFNSNHQRFPLRHFIYCQCLGISSYTNIPFLLQFFAPSKIVIKNKSNPFQLPMINFIRIYCLRALDLGTTIRVQFGVVHLRRLAWWRSTSQSTLDSLERKVIMANVGHAATNLGEGLSWLNGSLSLWNPALVGMVCGCNMD